MKRGLMMAALNALLFQPEAQALTTNTTVNFQATIQAASCAVNGTKGVGQTVDFGTLDVSTFNWRGKLRVPLEVDCSQSGTSVLNVDITVTPLTGDWGRNELKLQESAGAKGVINDYSLKLYHEDKTTEVAFGQTHSQTLPASGVTDISLWAELNQRSSTLSTFGGWNGAVKVDLAYN